MSNRSIKIDRTTQFNITAAGDNWTMPDGVTIETADAYGINVASTAETISLSISGAISMLAGADCAIGFYGDEGLLTIEATGRLGGQAVGVALTGDGADLVNHGKIVSTGSEMMGVVANGKENHLFNDGLIRADQAAGVLLQSGEQAIDNSGAIRGTFGIYVDSGHAVIDNAAGGKIVGSLSAIYAPSNVIHFQADPAKSAAAEADGMTIRNAGQIDGAVYLADHDDVVINSGVMHGGLATGDGQDRFVGKAGSSFSGDILLDLGNDVLDLRAGAFDSNTISGGADDDVYLVASGDLPLIEKQDEGYDTVKSSATFTLGDNFERLILTGAVKIDGTGNAGSNTVTGNDGVNKLFGLGGADWLSGGAGNDRLEGGSGADTFVFAKGFGKDTVADFQNGTDHIQYMFDGEIADIADLLANHVVEMNGDLLIQDGTDTLVLKNMDKSELDVNDFAFAM